MIEQGAVKIVDFLAGNGKIDSEEKELYVFGFKQVGRTVVNVVTTLLIGLAIGMWWQSLLFLAGFIPVRSFAGGYHAKTPERCYIVSVIMIAAALLWVRSAREQEMIPWMIASVSAVLIVVAAPVEHVKRPLSTDEKRVFGNKARIHLLVIVVIMLLSWRWNQDISLCLIAAIAAAAVLMAAGMIENRISGTRKKPVSNR